MIDIKSNMKLNYNLVDFMKFICSILVIFLHTFTSRGMGYYIKLITRIAVPFFFMCSGYFLTDKLFEENKIIRRIKIKKYIGRIILIDIIWSGVYVIVDHEIYLGNLSLIKTLISIAHNLFLNGVHMHLWYLSALCVCVILIYISVNKISWRHICSISLILYIFCLFGDLYYGIIKNTFLKHIIDLYIQHF